MHQPLQKITGACFWLCCLTLPAQVPIGGPNVNMAAGTTWPDFDPFLQRQNEPSIAVSSRNPVHLLAGANDYRSSLLQGDSVTICLVTNPNRLLVDAATTLASRMFSAIGVTVKWHEPPVCPAGAEDPVFLTLQTRTPEAQLPGALGVALPLEGSHAWVFYDRVLRTSLGDAYVAALLAHVMAHEIAHVLQGTSRHSESGILKARWSDTDRARMARFPLMFTREDAILIHHGLEERRARLISSRPAGRDEWATIARKKLPVRRSWDGKGAANKQSSR